MARRGLAAAATHLNVGGGPLALDPLQQAQPSGLLVLAQRAQQVGGLQAGRGARHRQSAFKMCAGLPGAERAWTWSAQWIRQQPSLHMSHASEGGRQNAHRQSLPGKRCRSGPRPPSCPFAAAHLADGARGSGGQHAEEQRHLAGQAELGRGLGDMAHERVPHGRAEEQHLRATAWRESSVDWHACGDCSQPNTEKHLACWHGRRRALGRAMHEQCDSCRRPTANCQHV